MANLYDDFDVSLEHEAVEKLRAEVEGQRTALQQLQVKEGAQGETIAVLERNMSALFATARLEVRRKDDEIGRLRKLVDRERSVVASLTLAVEAYLGHALRLVGSVQAAAGGAEAAAPLTAALAALATHAEAPFSAAGCVMHKAGAVEAAPALARGHKPRQEGPVEGPRGGAGAEGADAHRPRVEEGRRGGGGGWQGRRERSRSREGRPSYDGRHSDGRGAYGGGGGGGGGQGRDRTSYGSNGGGGGYGGGYSRPPQR